MVSDYFKEVIIFVEYIHMLIGFFFSPYMFDFLYILYIL